MAINDTTIKSSERYILTKNIEIGELISTGITAFSIMPEEKTKIQTYANNEIITKLKYNDIVSVTVDPF